MCAKKANTKNFRRLESVVSISVRTTSACQVVCDVQLLINLPGFQSVEFSVQAEIILLAREKVTLKLDRKPLNPVL